MMFVGPCGVVYFDFVSLYFEWPPRHIVVNFHDHHEYWDVVPIIQTKSCFCNLCFEKLASDTSMSSFLLVMAYPERVIYFPYAMWGAVPTFFFSHCSTSVSYIVIKVINLFTAWYPGIQWGTRFISSVFLLLNQCTFMFVNSRQTKRLIYVQTEKYLLNPLWEIMD